MSTKLLLVDDEPGVRMTLAANLELEGFEVLEAESGRDALRILQDQEFDVVLTDIRMPGMTGLELFQEIKRRNLRTPVVLTTAFFMEGQVNGALRDGAFAVLPKPSHVADVVATLSHAARRPFVLVVDEPASASTEVAAALGVAGLRARVATDGPSAIALVGSGEVDVCVISLASPAARAVDELYRLAPDLAIVTLSAEGAPELLQSAVARAAFACLRKPVETGDLVQIVAEARGRKRTAPRTPR
jgi:DNA-binding NtrC family response regulator